MSKFSELDMDRQNVERLTDAARSPTFGRSARVGRIVPPPPEPTMIEKGGFPRSTALAVIGGLGWVAFIAVITAVFFGAPRP